MLTIAQRRSISTRALFDPAFRELLFRNPVSAANGALGDHFTAGEKIIVFEEAVSRWAFVLPLAGYIEDNLPDPTDRRSAVENQVYALLRDEPDAIDAAVRDPRTFLIERFGVDVSGVDLRRESSGTTILLVPHRSAREELDDEMLDLVSAGGGNPADSAPKG